MTWICCTFMVETHIALLICDNRAEVDEDDNVKYVYLSHCWFDFDLLLNCRDTFSNINKPIATKTVQRSKKRVVSDAESDTVAVP